MWERAPMWGSGGSADGGLLGPLTGQGHRGGHVGGCASFPIVISGPLTNILLDQRPVSWKFSTEFLRLLPEE